MGADSRFRYAVSLADGSCHEITVVIAAGTLQCIEPQALDRPWTALAFEQCAACPLQPATQRLCPMAASLGSIVEKLGDLLSHEEVDADIDWGPRRLRARVPAQRLASSLIGLVAATSGCPKSAFLKPMAWFHLPFASEEETLFRTASTWLLGQYFVAARGEVPDWSMQQLKANYAALHEVNVAMARRLRAACESDGLVNAVVLLDLFAKAVSFEVEESLESLRPLFAALPR